MNLNQNGSPLTEQNLKLEEFEESFGDSEQNLSIFKNNEEANKMTTPTKPGAPIMKT